LKLDDHAVLPEVVAASAAIINRREQYNRARTTERMASFASDSVASNASSAGYVTFNKIYVDFIRIENKI
jgi:hypothetical protein